MRLFFYCKLNFIKGENCFSSSFLKIDILNLENKHFEIKLLQEIGLKSFLIAKQTKDFKL